MFICKGDVMYGGYRFWKVSSMIRLDDSIFGYLLVSYKLLPPLSRLLESARFVWIVEVDVHDTEMFAAKSSIRIDV